jgi:hypothetical protein
MLGVGGATALTVVLLGTGLDDAHGAQRKAHVYVVNATMVQVIDPFGRRWPCRDTACTQIPGALATDQLPLLSSVKSGSAPRTLLEVPDLIAGKYAIGMSGEDGYAYVQFYGNDGGHECGYMDVVPTRRGRAYWWLITVKTDSTASGCAVQMDRLRAAPRGSQGH